MPGQPGRELRRLIRDLGAIPPDLRKELRPELRRATAPLVQRARANAAWSTRIPSATKVSISFASRRPGVRVVVNPKKAPHATHYENEGRPGSFKHPLFGDRSHWYRQAARPFFYPALEAGAAEVADELADVVIRVARRHGFR